MARSRAAAGAVAAFCALLAWQLHVLGGQGVLFGDFHAFYCGASALMHGENPYLASPILRCESAVQPFGLYSSLTGLAEPAPFPGYAFALFAPFALLPYVPAALLWFAFIVAAAFCACALLARLADVPFAGALAVLGMGFAAAVLPLGELATIAACALLFAAYAYRNGRIIAAAIALCVGAVLPHVVVPALIALFVWERRARLPVAIAAILMAALDLAIGGPRFALSYFARVLPAHAQSEIGYVSQYGLTWVLHAAGASDRLALLCGNGSYAAMLIAGVFIAGVLSRRYREPALLVLVPPAFAVTAGAFMHYTEIMLAIPAALLLFVRGTGTVKTVAATAVLLLAVPWQWLLQVPLIVAAVVTVFGASAAALRWPAIRSLRAAGCAALFCCALTALALRFGPQVVSATNGLHIDPQLAQASWALYVRSHAASGGIVWWIAKAPTWIGLLLLAFAGAFAAAQKDFVRAASVEGSPVAT